MIQLRRTRTGLARLAESLPRLVSEEVDAAAERIAGGARVEVAVETGALKGSIETQPAGPLAASVTAGGEGHSRPDGTPTAAYARHVENKQPFLRPAAMHEERRFPRALKERIEREARGR